MSLIDTEILQISFKITKDMYQSLFLTIDEVDLL
jgi:hypothetical protein